MLPDVAAPPKKKVLFINRVTEATERRNRIANADAAHPLAATRQYAVFSCQGGGSRDFSASLQRPLRTLATPSGLILRPFA